MVSKECVKVGREGKGGELGLLVMGVIINDEKINQQKTKRKEGNE
jgi:hypothetical protein